MQFGVADLNLMLFTRTTLHTKNVTEETEVLTVIVGISLPGCLNCSVTISVISPRILYCI